MKILIIEDDIAARLVLKMRLRDANLFTSLDFETATNIKEARTLINYFRPDLITLDLLLDTGKMEDTIAAIPELSKAAPVIVVSGSHHVDLEKTLLSAGAVMVLDKRELSSVSIAKKVFSVVKKVKS